MIRSRREKKRRRKSDCIVAQCAVSREEIRIEVKEVYVLYTMCVCMCVCVRQFDGQSSIHLHDQDSSDQLLLSTTKRNTTHSAVQHSTVRAS